MADGREALGKDMAMNSHLPSSCHTIALFFLIQAGALCTHSYAQQIHVLMVADTSDSSIGDCCARTVQNVRSTFKYLVPRNRYTLQTLESARERYDEDKIINAIRRWQVGPDDTFVFLYDGHGGRSGGHHFLGMPGGGKLFSQKLQDAVAKKRCDLRIILTSSCNVPPPRPFAPKMAPAAPLERWDVTSMGMAPVMEELFIRHSGLMHMNSAWPGQFSFTSSIWGSWFFDQLLWYFRDSPTGAPTWEHIDRLLDRRLGQQFQMVFGGVYENNGYTQRNARTISWSFPDPWPNRKGRFGVTGDDDGVPTGVRVVALEDAGPGANLKISNGIDETSGRLRVGDVILTISGEEVKDTATYVELVRCSSRTMKFTFQRNGEIQHARTTLLW